MLKRYAWQWLIFWLGVILGGLSFPAMFWREDERDMLKDNFGLDRKDADGDPGDGLEEGFKRVGEPGRFFHDVKGIPRRLGQENAKVFFKLLSFVIVVLLASHLI
jgi:hypothetical protein